VGWDNFVRGIIFSLRNAMKSGKDVSDAKFSVVAFLGTIIRFGRRSGFKVQNKGPATPHSGIFT
jgi:hypothetical protein